MALNSNCVAKALGASKMRQPIHIYKRCIAGLFTIKVIMCIIGVVWAKISGWSLKEIENMKIMNEMKTR